MNNFTCIFADNTKIKNFHSLALIKTTILFAHT